MRHLVVLAFERLYERAARRGENLAPSIDIRWRYTLSRQDLYDVVEKGSAITMAGAVPVTV